MRVLPTTIVVFATILSVGCSRSSTKLAAQIRQTIESWSQTIQLTTNLADRAATPAAHIHQVVDMAREAVNKQQKQIERLSGAPLVHDDLQRRLESLRQSIDHLEAISGGRSS